MLKFVNFLFFASIGLLFNLQTLKATEIQRIVSLAPSLTQNLYYLDAEDKLVGCTSFCNATSGAEIVASAIKVNIEKVVVLKPDLVIATTITDIETLEMLKKMGLSVVVYPKADSFEEICQQFTDLAKIIGKEQVATKIIDNSTKTLEQLKKKIPLGKKRKVFLQIGASPIYTVFPGTFMDEYITKAEAVNIASDLTRGAITRESVIIRNPDIIFIVTMGVAGEEEKKTWQNIKEIEAAKSNKIFIIDSNKACLPTPVTFVETLDTMIHLMYP